MKDTTIQRHTALVKEKAAELGFDYCGIAKAGFLEEEAPKLENWLQQNMHGQMGYMANHFEKRLDPTKLVPGAKSMVMLMLNYYPEKDLGANEDTYKIAKYAYGEDYHHIIKWKLKELLKILQEEIGDIDGRVFVDSAPVMERQWAQKAGMGWIGKNSLLLNKNRGSFFFIAELILDLELEPDGPVKDYCGTCTRCIDACPTDAIVGNGIVDGSKCISYFTIELKDAIPDEVSGKFKDWIFGCDICQDVCPWNRFSRPHHTPELSPHEQLEDMSKKDWEEITDEVFRTLFKKSAIKRTKLEGLKRNIKFVQKK
ncbi:tRNA epoxyqueuosine(34) reductase QueG [Algivirga pacifica]|uniref:Epoxyqueuosine reductase n=1 Tax=Algivirga pacifica TaxID=1162670 RepID=A0ABP9D7H5_9BACT